MKRDFREEYKEYMNKKTPDLWERIESQLSEEELAREQEIADENEEPGRAPRIIDENEETGKAPRIIDENEETGRAPRIVNENEEPGKASVIFDEKKERGKNMKNNERERKIVPFRILASVAAAACVLGVGFGTVQLLQNSKNVTDSSVREESTAKADAATKEETTESQSQEKATVKDSGAETTAVSDSAGNSSTTNDTDSTGATSEDVEIISETEETGFDEASTEDVYYEESFIAATEEAYYEDGYAAASESGLTMASAYEEAEEYEVYWDDTYTYPVYPEGETYEKTETSGFSLVQSEPLSTFSADVDTASYANVRRMIEDGYSIDWITPDAVRPEEFINYFSYDLNNPDAGDKFGVTTKVAVCPWNDKHQLLMVGIKTEDIDLSEAPAENLTFLLDVSGSMSDSDKLPLLQKSFLQLVSQLDEDDTVSIVTYANGVEVVLDSVRGNDQKTITNAINGLVAEGGTYGEGGIQKAYELAEMNYREDANNRIILATDGDLNIGISEPDELEKFIKEKRDKGIYLSVLGFGTGNIRDDNMERLADCGNGNYAYIDSLLEARKVMVEEMGASFHTVAEDVKLQVEFNPDKVNAYRLIGYENRKMDATDFRDDTKDAGEIGAGHSVIALYELIPAESEEAIELKYQKKDSNNTANSDPKEISEYATVSIRYKEPGETTAREESYVVTEQDFSEEAESELMFAAAVAELAMVIRDDPNKGSASLEGILEIAKDYTTRDEYRQEFYYMVRLLMKNSQY